MLTAIAHNTVFGIIDVLVEHCAAAYYCIRFTWFTLALDQFGLILGGTPVVANVLETKTLTGKKLSQSRVKQAL